MLIECRFSLKTDAFKHYFLMYYAVHHQFKARISIDMLNQ